jgi:hypothetical protein
MVFHAVYVVVGKTLNVLGRCNLKPNLWTDTFNRHYGLLNNKRFLHACVSIKQIMETSRIRPVVKEVVR